MLSRLANVAVGVVATGLVLAAVGCGTHLQQGGGSPQTEPPTAVSRCSSVVSNFHSVTTIQVDPRKFTSTTVKLKRGERAVVLADSDCLGVAWRQSVPEGVLTVEARQEAKRGRGAVGVVYLARVPGRTTVTISTKSFCLGDSRCPYSQATIVGRVTVVVQPAT